MVDLVDSLRDRYRVDHPHRWLRGGYYCPSTGLTYYCAYIGTRTGDEFCPGCKAKVEYAGIGS